MNLHITINGKSYQAKQGQTVLEACREHGIFIPTLCHDPRLKPFGSCMICRVEIEGMRGVPLSCGTQVADGMVIITESPAINEARKTCLELLASQHFGDCTAPCMLECPAHMDVQGYIRHIARGEYKEAVMLMKETNPLPVVCGRVCVRTCETKCRRNVLEGTLGIAYLKRFAADIDVKSQSPYLPEKKAATGKKAAIIGAGPAGLSAAWYLAQWGHEVTIFERQEKPGGMLRYGIPSYRMPYDILDAEIDIIKQLGVEIQYNVEFGKDISEKSLTAEGFHSILLAPGSQIGWPLGVSGEENCSQVLIGVDFLGDVTRDRQADFSGKKVAVVGGGNTAMDCARTAVRLGAEVDLIYRRTVAEMPADKMEIEESLHEGVIFKILTNPTAVTQHGQKAQLSLVKMELGAPDESGRRRPQVVEGSQHVEEYDYVISAIGQTQDLSFVGDDCPVTVERERLWANEMTMETNVAGIFAAGDAVTGPLTAIKAIAGGKTAAISMDAYMLEKEIPVQVDLYNHLRGKENEDIDPEVYSDISPAERVMMPALTEKQREHNFEEVELGYTEAEAQAEAARCLKCGCADEHECKLRQYATVYEADQFALAGAQTLHPIDESHPYIVRDSNKCILCGRCVAICVEAGAGVLGFMGRGFDTKIEPSFAMPLGEDKNCINCGLCVSTCPVGALVPKDGVETYPSTAYLDEEGISQTEIQDAVAQVKK